MAANLLPATAAVGELADRPGVREALQWFTREKQWVNDIHLQLCRVPAPTFLEQQRAEWLASQFRALGWHTGIDRAGNVLASLTATPEGSLVAVTAHLDTVLAPRTKDDVSVDADGGHPRPGSLGQRRRPPAALLALAKALKSTHDPPDNWNRLLLIANVGEEGEGDLRGIRHICRQTDLIRRIHAFLVLDGAATDHITTHALGSRRYEITFCGARAATAGAILASATLSTR